MLQVVCLKHGIKYGPEYVNKLYRMVSRNLTVPHRFTCFTEDSGGLDSNIEVIHLPTNAKRVGWWWKPFLFKADHFPTGDTILYFDLDVVVVGDLTPIVDYKPGKFIGWEDPGKIFHSNSTLNSSVMRWNSGDGEEIHNVIEVNPAIVNKFPGDQDLIWHLCKDRIEFFPSDLICSYKWQVRTRGELIRNKDGWNFATVRNPVINPLTSVLVFHGTPDPHQVSDQIIVDNWC